MVYFSLYLPFKKVSKVCYAGYKCRSLGKVFDVVQILTKLVVCQQILLHFQISNYMKINLGLIVLLQVDILRQITTRRIGICL